MVTNRRLTSMSRRIFYFNTPITPLALGKFMQRLKQRLLIEIRPVSGREIPFRISALPDQEIAAAQFSGGANDQVGIGHTGCEKVVAHQHIVHELGFHAIFDHALDRSEEHTSELQSPTN